MPCVRIIASPEPSQYQLTFFSSIVLTQLIGAPLYFFDRNLFYSYMAVTKQSFALLSMSVTQWWGPTVMRISGDASVAGQIHQTEDGRVEFSFPERIVLIANHQVRTSRCLKVPTGAPSFSGRELTCWFRSTRTGSTSGGPDTRITRRCMATSTSF